MPGGSLDTRPPITWEVADTPRAHVKSLADALGTAPLLAQLLINRGVADSDAAQGFLNPGGITLSDPFELTDMQRAVDRIDRARSRNERIHIYGDYDADGITSTATLLRGLQRFGCEQVSTTVPNRFSDGYGLQPAGVERAVEEGVGLLITVDNGIKSFDAAAAARDAGIGLVITDHHQPGATIPPADAVVNPQRDDREAPFAHLCGAGVASRLTTALNGEPNDTDFVALGTVADLVPLVDENRSIVTTGLARMRSASNPGIHALTRHAGLNSAELTSESIAFQLAPRINAAARVGIGEAGLHLLLSSDKMEAARFAEQLHAANEERRRIEQGIFDEAVEMVELVGLDDRRTIVLGSPSWHSGVLGIVAARLVGAYGRPAALVAFDPEGVGKGSARSAPVYHLSDRLAACSDLLVRHGGHRAAGGFTVLQDRFDLFRERFEEDTRRFMPDSEPARTLKIDAILNLTQVDGQLLRLIENLEPYGSENPSPVFASYGVKVSPGSVRELRGGHLKFVAMQGRNAFDVIGFGMGEFHGAVSQSSKPIDIAYSPRLNTWKGETSIQLQLRDVSVPSS